MYCCRKKQEASIKTIRNKKDRRGAYCAAPDFRSMRKKRFYYLMAIGLLFVTVVFALYPFISNYLADMQHKNRINLYSEQAEELEEQDYQDIWEAVDAYNASLIAGAEQSAISFVKGEAQDETYQELLNVDGYGMIGYLEIPKINVKLPIYHGTGDKELIAGVGHLEGSSLPAGGAGTHVVLSSHSGYPSAELFTNLYKLEIGDTFTLYVLDRELTYQVDQIITVIPSDTSSLVFEDGKDCVTLFTCTPYGVNSHRLLVRGVRVDEGEEDLR